MIPNSKKIYLCSPDRKPQILLNGIVVDSVDFHHVIKGYSELSFNVDRYISINGQFVESNGYEDLKAFMYLYLEDVGFFQMQEPTIESNGRYEQKQVEAYSAEKEFEDKDYKGLKINTGESDSVEYFYPDNIDELGFAKRYVVMYDQQDSRFSFLHIVLQKVPYWSIGHVDASVRKAQIPTLDIDNENIYAIMTNEVAPRLQCLFVFDFLNFQINVYHKNSVDETQNNFDTGIFIGFRNLANQISINVDNDSIYTRFTVAGSDDLTIRHCNYGSDTIYNIDYFLGEPWMEESLAQKIKQFLQFRNDHIEDYIDLIKESSVVRNKISELKYTVPSDELYWKNWNSMNEEGLAENLKYFNSLLESFQIACDERPDNEKYSNYGTSNQKYNPILKQDGTVDHDYYLNILYENLGVYSGYYTYKEIIEFIIPFIELAQQNQERVQHGEETQDPFDDLGMMDPLENWDLYGYEELEGVRKSYEEDLATKLIHYQKAWDELTEEEKAEYSLNYISEEEYEASYQRRQYKHYMECLGNKDGSDEGTIYHKLKELKDEIDANQAILDALDVKVGEYNNLMQYSILNADTYQDSDGNEVAYSSIPQEVINGRKSLLFTQDEIDLITILLHDTDYTNTNIIPTQFDNTITLIDKEKELYEDAMEKLSEVSQPQYTFSVNLDNFLRLTQYDQWKDDFKLLKFIRLEIRDDYSVKLRIIGYRWNPCEVTPDIQLEFSNMITSKSGRSDLVQLLDLGNNVGSKNSISIGTGANARADQEYVAQLVQLLAKNSVFTKTVSGIASGVTGQIDATAVGNIVADYIGGMRIEADSVKVGNITGEAGEFESLISKYISSDYLAARVIDADQAKINELAAKVIRSNEINALRINVNQINADSGDFSQLSAKILEAGDATIKNLISQNITVDNIKGKKGEFDQFFITHLDVNEVFGNNARFKRLVADEINTERIIAGLGNFDSLFAESAFINKLNSNIINSFVNNAYDAYIRRAVIGQVSVAELSAGDIVLSDTMRILSENGALLMNGQTLQFARENEYGVLDVGIQIGYDNKSRPSLIIRDENGALLFTSQGMIGEDGLPVQKGISAKAIANQLIVGDMIHDKTISTKKLDFEVMQKGDTIVIDQVYTDAGTPFFGTEYTTFKDFTDSVFDVVYGKLFTWIAYSTNLNPAPDEFLDNPARARYVGIGTNKKTKDQSTDYMDYFWFQLPQTGTYVEEVEKLYHKSIYNDLEHIPSPSEPPQALAVDDKALAVQQGVIVTGSSVWSTTRPEYETGYSLWTSDKVKLSDGSYIYTIPEKLPDWDESNQMIGSTQLIRNSKTLVDTRIYWY